MRRIFLTGATGVMGMAGLRHLTQARYSDGPLKITVLARDSAANRAKLAPFIAKGVEVIWGDLLDAEAVARGVSEADVVLHVGGMVSPMADWYPEKTYKVNTGAMRNIIEAVRLVEARGEAPVRLRSGAEPGGNGGDGSPFACAPAQNQAGTGGSGVHDGLGEARERVVSVVYIGSVSQYGNRPEGVHWGRCGDPVNVATYDMYALSKCEAERMLAESGLRRWVSLRQTGIMYPRLLMKGSDPISFHVPLRGCLEWVTDDESGRLLAAVCDPALPDSFWRRFYNIGGGDGWRVCNYDFVNMTLSAVGCPPIYKVFERNWFATRNFHGIWYTDSDLLDGYLHFRAPESMESYLSRISKGLPWYFRLAPLAPAWLIKMAMKQVASKKVLGPLDWIASGNADRIFAAFGGREAYDAIPGWDADVARPLSRTTRLLDHGYDESKSPSDWDATDLDRAARFRGGRCLSAPKGEGIADTPVEWECSEGHRFTLTPRTVLLGGHWCGECLKEVSQNPRTFFRLAAKSPFMRQIAEKYD
ncbi:MAG: NAD(P)-dependent oxidoreductase [Muribaculaceae bacterium]|nr:NAD(P)-dependent oxidoreductase [Muribaculaceae bacterium]